MADGDCRSVVFMFRGVEHTVSLSMNESNQLTVEVEERTTADQWRNTFDSTYIEDVTFKTGNFKKFSVFVEMLESAMSQSSDAVTFDLLTYADLELLKEQRAGSGTRNIPGARSASLAPSNKKYLIVTYTVEFDRVHYPLPLPYVGKPDPRSLQDTIRRLRHEIKQLKQQSMKDYRIKELDSLRRDYDRLAKEKEALEIEFSDYKRQVELTTESVATKELRILKSLIKNLEEELATSHAKYQRTNMKRNKQYQIVVDELEDVKASERNLRIRVKSLTNELAQYKRKDSRAFPSHNSSARSLSRDRSGSRHNSLTRDHSHNGSVLHNRSADRNLSHLSAQSARSTQSRFSARDRSTSRERPPSATRGRPTVTNRSRQSAPRESSRSRDRCRGDAGGGGVSGAFSRLRIMSPAGTRYPRFDPTAYKAERERQRREAELKRKRTMNKRMSGSGDRASRTNTKPSPSQSFNSTDYIEKASAERDLLPFTAQPPTAGLKRRPSRSPSIGSIRSLISSVESLSDSGMRSDSSEYQRRKADQVLKSGRALLSANGWTDRSKVPSSETKPKVLSSTPENVVRTRSRISKKNDADQSDRPTGADDRVHHSVELSEIDERLSRLQQFMKENLQLDE